MGGDTCILPDQLETASGLGLSLQRNGSNRENLAVMVNIDPLSHTIISIDYFGAGIYP